MILKISQERLEIMAKGEGLDLPDLAFLQWMAQEIVDLRAENERLQKQLEPCTCQMGKCWQHDED